MFLGNLKFQLIWNFLCAFYTSAAQAVPVTSNIELDNLKAKTASIKAEIRQEKGMCEGVSQEQLEVFIKPTC